MIASASVLGALAAAAAAAASARGLATPRGVTPHALTAPPPPPPLPLASGFGRGAGARRACSSECPVR
jgi:hypothetical protein